MPFELEIQVSQVAKSQSGEESFKERMKKPRVPEKACLCSNQHLKGRWKREKEEAKLL